MTDAVVGKIEKKLLYLDILNIIITLMKTFSFFLTVLMALVLAEARAGWEPFGPEGIIANKTCFILDNHNHYAVCHNEGLYLYDQVTHEWTDYPTDLPVTDAYYLNGEDILVIMGCGTDSDGIYSFNPVSGEFTMLRYLECPYFIAYDETIQKYYVGHHLGLETSNDGLNWTTTDIFSGMSMVAMAISQNHIVVTRMDNMYGIWHSSDHGFTWQQSPPGVPMIGDMAFDQAQKLWGIFPDLSFLSGLWSSSDFGYSWGVEFWSVNMKCVCIDVLGDVYVGWDENSMGGQEGIARWDPVDTTLYFINEGLSSLVINDISVNPVMSAPALFCCTDDGAYFSLDYVGMPEITEPLSPICLAVFPNPASGIVHVTYGNLENFEDARFRIFQADGREVFLKEIFAKKGMADFDLTGLSPGIYLVVLDVQGDFASARLIVR